MIETDIDFLTRLQKVLEDPAQEASAADMNRLFIMYCTEKISFLTEVNKLHKPAVPK